MHPAEKVIIKSVQAFAVALPLTKPIKMAHAVFETVENVIVRIESDDGFVGWGEAASAPSLTGETWQGMMSLVETYIAPLLVGRDARLRAKLLSHIEANIYGATGSISAVEIALIDLLGQRFNVPFSMLIGGMCRDYVEPMWILGNGSVDADLADAKSQHKKGYRSFKLKGGTQSIDQEIEATLRLRDLLGADSKICIDANSGYDLAGARKYIAATLAARVDFIEQPFPRKDLASLKALAADGSVPICADQSVHDMADIHLQSACGVSGIALKLNKLGGVTAALHAADICDEHGMKIIVAAKVAESSIASSAIMHLASIVPSVEWGVSLTHAYLAADLVRHPLGVTEGKSFLGNKPGLGIEVDLDNLDRFRIK
jgi:muconate cycloisomerase